MVVARRAVDGLDFFLDIGIVEILAIVGIEAEIGAIGYFTIVNDDDGRGRLEVGDDLQFVEERPVVFPVGVEIKEDSLAGEVREICAKAFRGGAEVGGDIAEDTRSIEELASVVEVFFVDFHRDGVLAEKGEGDGGVAVIGAGFKGGGDLPLSDKLRDLSVEEGVVVEGGDHGRGCGREKEAMSLFNYGSDFYGGFSDGY